jgi:RimJ/RimL family protein N-acetyltransferase
MTALRFDPQYEEWVPFAQSRVRLRMLREDDGPGLLGLYRALSMRSRYFRFLASPGEPTDAHLASLLRTDGDHRLAIVAEMESLDLKGFEIVGVARFSRFAEDPSVAEAALVVRDAYQGHGLGTLLADRLCAAARERGIERFRAEVLTQNSLVMRALEAHGAVPARIPDDDAVTFEFLLDADDDEGVRGPRAHFTKLMADVAHAFERAMDPTFSGARSPAPEDPA